MSMVEDIKAKALELGFDLAGITGTGPIDNEQYTLFNDWLALGYAGRMNYMRENIDKRTNPAKLLNNAQSVICVGLNYKPPKIKQQLPEPTGPTGRVANYAQYEDYHLFIKKQLHKLADFIGSASGKDYEFKICVDSVPLAERGLAVRAGLGFIGKNHMLINPEFGPQIFLGEIVTSLKLQADEPIADSCRNCNKCIEACPTGALRSDGQLDANKCISYLTIEHSQGGRLSAKGQLPADLVKKVGDRLFGCDECVMACPYQKDAPECGNKQFKFYSDRARLDLGRILNMTEADFEEEFADSPIKRTGLEKLKRNAQICFVNATSGGI